MKASGRQGQKESITNKTCSIFQPWERSKARPCGGLFMFTVATVFPQAKQPAFSKANILMDYLPEFLQLRL